MVGVDLRKFPQQTLAGSLPRMCLHDKFRVNASPMNGLLDPHLDAPPLFDGAGLIVEIIKQSDLVKLPKVLIQFDLTLPIEPQLEGARQLLLYKAKIKNFPALPPVRPQIDKLSSYLRLLDFHAEGVSDKEIGSALYPHLLGDRERLHDAIRKDDKTARHHQDNYLLLVLH
jgi:hypothetical protein